MKKAITILVGVSIWLVVSQAHAEFYLNIKGGYNFPSAFSGFHAEYAMQSRQYEDDLQMQSGLAYGGTVGYCHKEVPWLCLEVEAIKSWPNAKQQYFTQFSRQPGGGWVQNSGILAGGHWRMFTLGPNLILRHAFGVFEERPLMVYAGGGSPLFMGNYGGDRQNPSFGFNGVAGLRYAFTENGNWRALLEAHYFVNKGTYKEQDGAIPNGFSGTYQAVMVLVGIERRFAW